MNKYEFVTELQKYLTGKVSTYKLQDLTRYYQDYIDTEIKKGRTEEEVIASLGDPRLLAKSIVTAQRNADTTWEEERSEGYANEMGRDQEKRTHFMYNGKEVPKWKLWLYGILAIIAVFAVFALVGRVLGFAFVLFFRYIFPFLMPIAAFYLIYVLFFGKK